MRTLTTFVLIATACGLFFCQQPAQPQYFFVFLNTNPERAELSETEVNALQDAHLANITRLAADGTIIAAGPFEGGGGMFIFETATLDETRDSLYTDPAIQANRFLLEIYPLSINHGQLHRVGDTYEMGTFQFVRFAPSDTAVSSQSRPEKYHRFAKTQPDQLVFAGDFGTNDGGFLLYNASAGVADSLSTAHPWAADQNTDKTVRTLWIAKETFGVTE